MLELKGKYAGLREESMTNQKMTDKELKKVMDSVTNAEEEYKKEIRAKYLERPITEDEVSALLKAIEDGSVLLTSDFEPQLVYAGNVLYYCSGSYEGWKLLIFNDCNEWDYIDTIEAPDGRIAGFYEIEDFMPMVWEYRPSSKIVWERYGIPGYKKFRKERWFGFSGDVEKERELLRKAMETIRQAIDPKTIPQKDKISLNKNLKGE